MHTLRSLRILRHSIALRFWNAVATRAENYACKHYGARSRLICSEVITRPSLTSR